MPATLPDDPAAAAGNRAVIEAALRGGGALTLPVGTVYTDRAPLLTAAHAGATLAGAGRTVLRSLDPADRGLIIHGGGVGYADVVEAFDGSAVTMSPTDIFGRPFDAANWSAGRVCWGFKWNAFYSQQPPTRVRYVVRSVAARKLLLDRPADPALDRLKWCDGSPIADAGAGRDRVRLEEPADAAMFRAGMLVAVSGGPVIAHELLPEYRRVVGGDHDGTVHLDRPLCRTHTDAALVRVAAAANITIRGLTVAQPAGGGVDTVLAKFAAGLRLDGVGIGVPDEPAAGLALASCGDVVIDGCDVLGQLGVTACHDVSSRGGRFAGMSGAVFEEGCMDCLIDQALIRSAGGNGVHGVQAYLGSERVTVRDTLIVGYGHDAGGGHGWPLNLGGAGCAALRVTTAGTDPATGNYVAGDGLLIDRLVTDVSVIVSGGRGVLVRDSRATAWGAYAGTSGRMLRCEPGPKVPGGWEVAGSATAADA
jgi:hypothetical protein